MSSQPPTIDKLFVTQLYRGAVASPDDPFLQELDASCRAIAEDDVAGQRWCRKNGYPGYTSYASLNDLPWRFPVFKELRKRLDRHVADFVKALEYDLAGRKVALDSLWINVLPRAGRTAPTSIRTASSRAPSMWRCRTGPRPSSSRIRATR